MSKQNALSYLEFLSSDVVSLQAGQSGPKFKIHLGLLEAKCAAIIPAFRSGFEESQNNIYTFQDTSAGTLGRFIEWAYTGDYSCVINATSPVRKKNEEGKSAGAKVEGEDSQTNSNEELDFFENDSLLANIRVYIFCCIYCISDLQQLSFEKMSTCLIDLDKPHQLDEHLAVIAALRVAFLGLPADDHLLDWLAQYAAYCVDRLRLQTDFLDLLREFPALSSRMIPYLVPASSPPWKTKIPSYFYAHYSSNNRRDDDSG
ncbi:hypothetical protein BJY01DRAFT_212779 [Aspergillus pseudoustus]|uniref:BTB domain-containing protein n=1 Tax=Aspergillus pseudoustus TaxID=1810923 RepID=A0ABR4K7U0_9EURO